MKILHTADWHIGQTLAGYDRHHEHAAVLASLADICRTHEVDALIVAGDIFDHQNPSGASQQLFYATLRALRLARPSMTIVITAGNHDAAGRLEAPAVLINGMGVHVIGNARRIDGRLDAARHLIPLIGPSGAPEAAVLAVSYPTPACLPPFGALTTEDGVSSIVEATRAFYAEMWDRAGAGRDGLSVIVTGHLHVSGAVESEGAERRILIGGQHAVPPTIFPANAAYVALGHLHKAQSFHGGRIRYSGSLMPLSATEAGYDHGVTLITLEGGAVAQIEHISIPRPVPFLRLPTRGDMRLDEVGDRLASLALPADLVENMRPFVHIQLSHDGLVPGHRALIDQIAAAFPVRIVASVITRPETGASDVITDPTDIGPMLDELKPLDMFRDAFTEKHGSAPDTAHERAFHEALAAAES